MYYYKSYKPMAIGRGLENFLLLVGRKKGIEWEAVQWRNRTRKLLIICVHHVVRKLK